MKKIIVLLLVLVCIGSAWAVGSQDILKGKWNIQFIVNDTITSEATGLFNVNNATFEYFENGRKDLIYKFRCGFGASDKVTFVAYPLEMKTFRIKQISKTELYLIDLVNEDYLLRLTR